MYTQYQHYRFLVTWLIQREKSHILRKTMFKKLTDALTSRVYVMDGGDVDDQLFGNEYYNRAKNLCLLGSGEF